MKKEIKFYEFVEDADTIFNNTSIPLKEGYKLVYCQPTGIEKDIYFTKDKNKSMFNILNKEIYPNYPNEVFTLCIMNNSLWTGKSYTEKPHLFIYVKEED